MQSKLKYPVGIQTFSEIIKGKYTYVDKTGFIPTLISTGKYVFLSRPRRFGKSLLLSTLHSYFAGDRELFKGLAIETMDVEWKARPILHIDFNSQNYLEENGLELMLDHILSEYEHQYEANIIGSSFSIRFASLLKTIYQKTGEQAVILIDEYDKPLLAIEDKPEIFEKNQAILKSFFGVLKSSDRHIHFAILSGVARFNKVSIFSDLNNLYDISLDDKFSEICGWTHHELTGTFRPGIEHLADRLNLTYEETLNRIKDFYDGYRFSPEGELIYNPFSVLNLLSKQRFSYFWYHTGTPTFLVKRIIQSKISFPLLNDCYATETQLLSVGVNDPNPIPLLFQTGYLTIRRADGDLFELQFPNREVEIGFANSLQPLFLPELGLNEPFSILKFRKDIVEGQPEDFMNRMVAMIKAVPYEQHHEKFYQNVVYLVFTLLGADARVEEHTNVGRTDLVVRTKEYVYIFEFKYEESAQKALAQIYEKDYPGRFAAEDRVLFLIGANFSKEKRGLENWIIERK